MRLSKDEAARRIGLTDSAIQSSVEKLEALESGETVPTQNQLINIAKVYHQELLYFYRDEPPKEAKAGIDFRSNLNSVSAQDDAILKYLIRDMRVRQEMLASLLEDEDDRPTLDFIGKLSLSDELDSAVAFIKNLLHIGSSGISDQTLGKSDKDLEELRSRVEAIGVYVLIAGNLGTSDTDIETTVFRGFALSDHLAPLIVINEHDSKNAMAFTLLHELVHICTGSSGISGLPSIKSKHTSEHFRLEQFCNDVASEILLPDSILSSFKEISHLTFTQIIDFIDNVSTTHGVSKFLVTYRLWRRNLIKTSQFQQVSAKFSQPWLDFKSTHRERNRTHEGGPSYYAIRKYKLGNRLIRDVEGWYRSGDLTPTKAATVLGVEPGAVPKLLSA